MRTTQFGYQAGDTCRRPVYTTNGECDGIIAERSVENCSCHIAPPCSACTAPREYCPACDWEASNDEIINDFKVNVVPATGEFRCWEPRPLDASKIDWRTKPHTNASQICEGVYPTGTPREEVEAKVRGTFGGRFERFSDGQFRYIAYTD